MKISSISPAKITQSRGLGGSVSAFTFKKTCVECVLRTKEQNVPFDITHVPMCRHFAEAWFLCKKKTNCLSFSQVCALTSVHDLPRNLATSLNINISESIRHSYTTLTLSVPVSDVKTLNKQAIHSPPVTLHSTSSAV